LCTDVVQLYGNEKEYFAMSTDLVSRSSFTATGITKADSYDVQQVATQGAKVTVITDLASREIAQIGAQVIMAMAQLTQGAESTRRQLLESGVRNDVYDDAHSKVLQVTGQNLITLGNTGQKAVAQAAASMMR
jgi:hypothetical protein